jgi:glycosyltransferase involved in cell wall biosynthesis
VVTDTKVEVSVVIPCLNEAQSVDLCVDKARAGLKAAGIDGEVVVADNGSTDGSQQVSVEYDARGAAASARFP